MNDTIGFRRAIFAAGCFWDVEAAFRRIPGVIATTAGYSGGMVENPSYEEVQEGNTMHAEAVEIAYDRAIVSYSQLLDAFWEMHDPTIHTDPQYRSAIFFPGSEEQELAQKSLTDQTGHGQGNNPILTAILSAGIFWIADECTSSSMKKCVFIHQTPDLPLRKGKINGITCNPKGRF